MNIPQILILPEYIETIGKPHNDGRTYHRFHLPLIDAWGVVSYIQDPEGLRDGGPNYVARYLAHEMAGMRETEARQWMRDLRQRDWSVLHIPDGWTPPEKPWPG